jgi:hypothetical protein
MNQSAAAKKIADETPPPNGLTRPQNVTEAIARVMADLPAIGKTGQAAASQGGYAYRGIEAITSEAQSLFGKYGVVFVPQVRAFDIKDIVVAGKPWTDTILTVEYTVYGPNHGALHLKGIGDEKMELTSSVEDFIVVGPLIAIGRDNSDKGANKAMTQAFKYALLQVLCISDKKDDSDGHNFEADARPAPPDPEIVEAKQGLADVIASVPDDQQTILKSHLRGRFGAAHDMTLEDIAAATAVAAGWPETAETEPAPEALV